MNRYAYAANSPVNYADPSGNQSVLTRALKRTSIGTLGTISISPLGIYVGSRILLLILFLIYAGTLADTNDFPGDSYPRERLDPDDLLRVGKEIVEVGTDLVIEKLKQLLREEIWERVKEWIERIRYKRDKKVDIYRAVFDPELAVIISTGTYGSSPSENGKYFALTVIGVWNFATSPFNANKKMTITSVDIPISFLAKGYKYYDVGGAGPSIHFAQTILPELYLNMGVIKIVGST